MHLTRLTLSHFRSHVRTVVETDGRPVTIVGPNGSGKTNLIEAVSLLSPGRGLRRVPAGELMRRPEELGWRIGADICVGETIHEIDTRAEPDESRQVRIDGKMVPQSALGRLARILWLVPSMDRLWTEGAEGRRRFLDRITLSFLPGHGDAMLTYEKAMRERNRLLKNHIRDSGWYRALEARMAETGAEVVAGRYFALEKIVAAQTAAETAFPVSELSIINPKDAVPITAEALAEGRPRDMAVGRTLLGPHRADLEAVFRAKGVPASQCSTGEQKALLISLILANARALKAEMSSAPVLLLDEVAAHLDAERRAALYDEITMLEAQAWMTGTGEEFFKGLGARAQRFTVSEASGVSQIERA